MENTERRHGKLYPPQESGLAANGRVREGFGKALQAKSVVPTGGEAFVLAVQLKQGHIMATHDGTGELFYAHVVIAPVLCEAPDYVKWAYDGELRRSVYRVPALALLNIVCGLF